MCFLGLHINHEICRKLLKDANLDLKWIREVLKDNEKEFISLATTLNKYESYQRKIDDSMAVVDICKNLPKEFSSLYQPTETPADGNCMWNMISISICGDWSWSNSLRILTLFTLFKLKEQFKSKIRRELLSKQKYSKLSEEQLKEEIKTKYKKHLGIARIASKWGNEYHLLALSTFLNRSIYLYSYENLKNIDKNMSHDELQHLLANEDKSGLHFKCSPIDNTIFSNNNQKGQTLYGLYLATDPQHYTSLIPLGPSIPEFIPNSDINQLFWSEAAADQSQ